MEAAELDEDMIAKKSQRQKWKSASSREDCCKAYRLAANTIFLAVFSPFLKETRTPRWRRRMSGIHIESLLAFAFALCCYFPVMCVL